MQKTQVIMAIFCLNSGVFAQNVPDAGALMRQTEQMMHQSQMQQLMQRRQALPPKMDWAEFSAATAHSFKFSGNKHLSTTQLNEIAAPFLNRPLTQTDFQRLTDAVSEGYRASGWLVQAYVPRQDLSQGEVLIQVIETIPPNTPR
jgi:hemolysin activation/secretion protein